MDLASKEFLKLYSLLLENRDPEKEREILKSKSADRAYNYSSHIIKGRWPEAEEFIMKTVWAWNYSKHIIKGRWPEAEEHIKQDAWCACRYAADVIKGRWPEAEDIIKKDPFEAVFYARKAIKGRWPEAEEYISKDYDAWCKYIGLICKKCDGDGVISLGIGGAEDECSRCNGGGFDQSKI